MTLVTLFTDASFCDQTKIGAYAIWAKSSDRKFTHSGVLKNLVDGATLAETMALVNGISAVIAVFNLGLKSKIIAQTDCIVAIQALDENRPFKRSEMRRKYEPLILAYKAKIAHTGVAVEFRHVGAHKGTVTPRNAVNTWCDEECRRLMRQARKEATQ